MKRFKKNKNEFDYLLSEYRASYYFSFLLMYFLLTMILGVLAFVSTSKTYLESTESIILEYVDEISAIAKDDDIIEIDLNPSDPRMVVSYAYEEKNQKLSYLITGSNANVSSDAYSVFWSAANKERKFNQFSHEKIGAYQHLVYNIKLNDNKNILVDGNVVLYVTVFMNIQGEMASRASFIRVYMICAAIMIAISFASALLMSKRTLKPLKDFVQKQVDFVSDASHELRTPLAVVQSKIENILANPNKTVFEVSEELAISLSEINRLNKLTNELLTLARSDKNTIVLNLEVCNISDLVSEIIEPFKEIFEINNRGFEYNSYECYSKVDRDKIKQIIYILLDNAIKYTNEEDKVIIYVYINSNDVCIEVVDTGFGMSDEAIKHVFERFYREDKARSRETGGTGLGLSIASTLVNLHKGTIRAEHNNPKGSRFIITLPRVKKI